MINRRDQLKTTDGKSGLRWLYDYPVWSLSTLFAMAITVLMWNVFTVSHALTVDGAIRYAEQYLESLDKFRSAYSSEVVNRVKKAGIKVSADYRMHDNQILFPATFSLILARSINAGNSGVKTNLYSNYPWPWR